MVDDLGKEWLSCYGSDVIKTPNIDNLAAEGMTFNNAYSMPSCTSSRTTLLTGKYPWRNGYVNHWDVPRWGVAYFDWKKKENTTFARLMKNLGYATYAAGKWQINDFRVEPQAMKKHGFDDWAMWTGSETGNEPSETRFYDAYVNTPEGSRPMPENSDRIYILTLLLTLWVNIRRSPCASITRWLSFIDLGLPLRMSPG